MPNKKYKLIYNTCYNNDDFRIGFGDCKNFIFKIIRFKDKETVGLTNEGLFIEGKKFDDTKLEKGNSEVIFIIDLTDNKNYFELLINKRWLGKYHFSLNSIYALAAFRKGSVKIKTLISNSI